MAEVAQVPGPEEPAAFLLVAPPQVLRAALVQHLVLPALPCLVLQAVPQAELRSPEAARSAPFHRDGPWRGPVQSP